jgi:hypothetical protein
MGKVRALEMKRKLLAVIIIQRKVANPLKVFGWWIR